jgi:hypothetical protein
MRDWPIWMTHSKMSREKTEMNNDKSQSRELAGIDLDKMADRVADALEGCKGEDRAAFAFIRAALTRQAAPEASTTAWLIDPGPGSARDRAVLSMPDAFVYADVLASGGSITELIRRPALAAPEAPTLTDEQIIAIRNAVGERYNSAAHVSASGAIEFARAIERELRASTGAAPEAPVSEQQAASMEARYENLLRIQQAEAASGDPYMLGMYNGMLMMCANEDGKIFDPFVPAATTASTCQHEYAYFGDQLARRCIRCDAVEATMASASTDLIDRAARIAVNLVERGLTGDAHTINSLVEFARRAPAPSQEAAPLPELVASALREIVDAAKAAKHSYIEQLATAALGQQGAAQASSREGSDLNGGMHASIFVKVWGDAGGGDAGRIALANYAYDLGKRAAQVPHAGADTERLKALHAAVSALYFDDSSDFRSALGSVIRFLDPELAGDMLGSPKAAYDKSCAAMSAATNLEPKNVD